MNCKAIFILSLLLLLTPSCYKQSNTITSAGKVNLHADGTIANPEGTESDSKIRASQKAIKELNKKYPHRPPFGSKEETKVQRVEADGLIVLENNLTIRLIGIQCEAGEKNNILTRFLQEKTVTFVEVPEYGQAGYLWTVDYSFLVDPRLKDSIKGPSYSCVNEVAILSGWCENDPAVQHPFKKRFEELQEIAGELHTN